MQFFESFPLAVPCGQVENNVSPKYSSLALDEAKEQHNQELEMDFEPELSLLIPARQMSLMDSSSQIIKIGGRVTVSF